MLYIQYERSENMEREEYITDEQVVERAKAAVRIAVEKKRILGTPIVAYDSSTQEIYRINGDGSKTVVGKAGRGGRYSERQKAKQKA